MTEEINYKFPFICPKCNSNKWKVDCKTEDLNREGEIPSTVYDLDFGIIKFTCLNCGFDIEKNLDY